MGMISRSEARSRGLYRYFTGKPCKYGHVAERMVCNAGCVTCTEIKLCKWAKTEQGRKGARERQRRYRKGRQYVETRPKEVRNAQAKKSYTKNIYKVRARTAVRDALKRGELMWRACSCGNPKAQAHHHDYSKPLEVEWLCAKCHGNRHRIDT